MNSGFHSKLKIEDLILLWHDIYVTFNCTFTFIMLQKRDAKILILTCFLPELNILLTNFVVSHLLYMVRIVRRYKR